jgi:DNA-binding MarR family transcriptional regulator
MADFSQTEVRHLVRFRHTIRRLLRASEEAARLAGLSPHHHQLLLGIAGFTDRPYATISELAEFLQLRHHSVVGLVDRAEAMGLVRRRHNPANRREVYVSLTGEGSQKLRALASLHRKELNGMRRSLDILDFASDHAPKRTKPRPAKKRGRPREPKA